jgi:predicted RNA-binding protein YlxR (DUF448 family)
LIEISLVPTDYELQALVTNLELISYKALPNTYKSFKMASALIMYTWKSYAMGSPIPGGGQRLKNPTGAYAKSIKIRTLTPLNREIYSDSPIAKYIEDGTKEYDMKKTHPFGPKGRVSKEGNAYIIIPFRHGTPSSLAYSKIPEQMYQTIRQAIKNDEITLSNIKKGRRKRSQNYSGEMIPRANYNWGTRIGNTGVDNLEGMVVMDVSTKKSSRSAYFTFRIISVNSPANKWIQKARAARNITKYVVINTQEIVKELIENGLKKDLGVVE